MPDYTIEKARPPKKEHMEKEEVKKNQDVFYAVFGDYEKKIDFKIPKTQYL